MRLVKNLETAIDRTFYMLTGALLTLSFLRSASRDFSPEMGIVMLALFALGLLNWWSQRRKRRAESGGANESPSIHAVLAIAFGAAAGSLFIARYTFGIQSIGNWFILPGLFAWIASFFIAADDPRTGDPEPQASS